MDPITATSSVAGLLSLAIRVGDILYVQIRTFKNAPKEAKELSDELETLCQVLTSLKKFLESRESKGIKFEETSAMLGAISGCERKLTELKLKFEKFVNRQGFSQLAE